MQNRTHRFSSIHFSHPEPPLERRSILPAFIPFLGCRTRCVFCAQEKQTGRSTQAVSRILDQYAEELTALEKKSAGPLELAFYGGTFTALSKEDFNACLKFSQHWRERGLISRLRCSTRPDALDATILSRLRDAGFTLVELGIQSFSTSALAAAGRGYSGEQALEACALVHESGLELGIQLMPGMPGVDMDTARQDVLTAAGLKPEYARLYPCLVLEGSGLAALWRSGSFRPWEEDETISFLAEACVSFWQSGTRVIRMGLAAEEGLSAAILAGPWHPSLGSRARGLALSLLIKEHMNALRMPASAAPGAFVPEMAQHSPMETKKVRFRLTAPKRYQGEFWGFRKELTPRYAALGLFQEDITWCDEPDFFLERIA